MKTLGRLLMIVLALAIVMGLIYVAVNATTANVTATNQRFERGERPEFPDGDRERGEGFALGGFGLILGAIKNIVVISIIVALIVVPKGRLQRSKRQPQIQ